MSEPASEKPKKPFISPLIKFAPTAVQKKVQRDFNKSIDNLMGETGTSASKRNEDLFIGGPLDGHKCQHGPNGPEQSWDKGRHWSDYYFKDKMRLPTVGRWVEGYHIYSSSKALMILDSEMKLRHPEHASGSKLNLGTRTAHMRKCYYYCGFMEDDLLHADGIVPEMFTGILSIA